ncbi:MAG: hypothetical protein H7Z16_18750 [Pyrinomonadaceae bacterium]|nr:hypothetical protein [Pyrinomonadaceae bacterium]
MKHKPVFLALLLTLLFGSTLAHGQDSLGPRPKKARTPEDYKLRTLKEIAEVGSAIASERDDDRKGDATTLVHGDLLPSRVRVIYKGTARPLPQLKKDVISQWSNLYAGSLNHYTVQYKTDVLFNEAGLNHWLVVNKRVLPQLRRRLKKGRPVDLYLIRLGAFKTGDRWRWVLLVEDFATPK